MPTKPTGQRFRTLAWGLLVSLTALGSLSGDTAAGVISRVALLDGLSTSPDPDEPNPCPGPNCPLGLARDSAPRGDTCCCRASQMVEFGRGALPAECREQDFERPRYGVGPDDRGPGRATVSYHSGLCGFSPAALHDLTWACYEYRFAQ